VVLVLFSWFIRRRISESPAFLKMKASGRLSTNPLKETLTRPENLKTVAIALVGATAGQAVVWYTGQFYALYFLQTVLKIDFINANIAVAGGLILGTPAIVVAGALSDRIGRKPVILAGFVAALVAWFPIYRAMTAAAAVPGDPDMTGLMLLVAAQVAIVGLVYGPMAAFLVEMFPTRIRYTSMSLPYHLGNGLFGGLVPYIGTAMVAKTGDLLRGTLVPDGRDVRFARRGVVLAQGPDGRLTRRLTCIGTTGPRPPVS
jgi:MFS family permease